MHPHSAAKKKKKKPSDASTLIINLSMFKDLAIERPSLRAHKPFLMFYTPKFIVPLGVTARIKTYCFIRVEKENKFCTIILGNYKISSWCIFVCQRVRKTFIFHSWIKWCNDVSQGQTPYLFIWFSQTRLHPATTRESKQWVIHTYSQSNGPSSQMRSGLHT